MLTKVWVSGQPLAAILGSNPARDMDLCLLWRLCVVRYRCLRRAGLSSRGFLPSVECLSECDQEVLTMRRPWPTRGCQNLRKKKKRKFSKTVKMLHLRKLRFKSRIRAGYLHCNIFLISSIITWNWRYSTLKQFKANYNNHPDSHSWSSVMVSFGTSSADTPQLIYGRGYQWQELATYAGAMR